MAWPVVQHDHHGEHQGEQADQGTDQRGGQAQARTFDSWAWGGRWLLAANAWEPVLGISGWSRLGRLADFGFASALLRHGALLQQPLAGPAIV